MFRSRRHTDVEIVVDDRTFQCHKTILAAVSPYFDAMFASGMKEAIDGVVHIHDVSGAIFENILNFIYTGQRLVTTDNVEELLKAAAVFQVKFLHDKCESFLLEKVCPENCIGAWKLAKAYDCPTLCVKSWNLLLEHFADTCRSEEFIMLDAEDIISIITNDNLVVANEEVVCDSVLRWYNSDQASRKDKTIQIFEHLRLPLLGSEYLLHEIESMNIVVENPRCREVVKEAISYQMLLARRPEYNSPRIAFRRHSNYEEVLVIIGGYNSTGDKMVDILTFSFLQHKWFKLTPLPYVLGREFASCVYGNDIFVSGGSQKPEGLLRFRSDINDWYKGTSLIRSRRRHAMVAVGGSIYILGGYDDNQTDETARTLSEIEEYDINARNWKRSGNLSMAVRSMTAAVSKEKILVFGGILPDDKETDAIQAFDTRLLTSYLLTGMPSKCKLSKAVVRDKQTYVFCTDGNILEVSENGECHSLQMLENFNRRRFGAVHFRGNILIIGGETGNVVHQDMMTFNPDTKEVKTDNLPTIPTRANFGGLIIVLQKKFLSRQYRYPDVPSTQ